MNREQPNLKNWLLRAAGGEPIEAVVIGEMSSSHSEDVPRYAEQPRGKVLTWEEAAPWLDYTFNDDFGGAGCNPVYAWTKTKVITIGEYDGSTDWQVTPRHPVACEPEYR